METSKTLNLTMGLYNKINHLVADWMDEECPGDDDDPIDPELFVAVMRALAYMSHDFADYWNLPKDTAQLALNEMQPFQALVSAHMRAGKSAEDAINKAKGD